MYVYAVLYLNTTDNMPLFGFTSKNYSRSINLPTARNHDTTRICRGGNDFITEELLWCNSRLVRYFHYIVYSIDYRYVRIYCR